MNGNTISVGIAVVSVVVAAVYSFLTFLILRANRRVIRLMEEQLESLNRPYVSIDTFTFVGSPLFKLRIRNLGNSAARNVRLTLDRDFYRLGNKSEDHNLRTTHAFMVPIPSFAPKAELTFDLGVYWQMVKEPELTPTQFEVTAEYEYPGRKITETTQVDLDMFHHSALNPEPLVVELRGIKDILDKRLK